MARKFKAVIDLAVIIVLVFTFFSLRWWVNPIFRGYFETDISIRYPFVRESIVLGVLGGVGACVFLVTVLATEIIRHKNGLYKYNKEIGVGGKRVQMWLKETCSYMSVFLYGHFTSMITVYVGKLALGRLRPHFIDVCRPSPWTDAWSVSRNSYGYIRWYSCTGSFWTFAQNARMSFPSAHASIAMYTSIFFILYLEKKARWHAGKAMRHLVQFGALLVTWYVGTTRIVENYSHWSDVAVGYLIGGVFAASFFYYNFKPRKQQENPEATNVQQPINVSVVSQQPINGLQNLQPIHQPPQYQINNAQPIQADVDAKVPL